MCDNEQIESSEQSLEKQRKMKNQFFFFLYFFSFSLLFILQPSNQNTHEKAPMRLRAEALSQNLI